jgi:hypothetical protein
MAKMALPRHILEAFEKIVDYMWNDEERDYEEKDRPEDHIFASLSTIHDWLRANCPEYEEVLAQQSQRRKERLDRIRSDEVRDKNVSDWEE